MVAPFQPTVSQTSPGLALRPPEGGMDTLRRQGARSAVTQRERSGRVGRRRFWSNIFFADSTDAFFLDDKHHKSYEGNVKGLCVYAGHLDLMFIVF